jgi:hypothetical protein
MGERKYNLLQILGLVLYSAVVIFIYSILPDIDARASQIRFILTVLLSGVGLAYSIFYNQAVVITSLSILLFIWLSEFIPGFQHRGIMHWWIMPFIFALPLMYYFGYTLAIVGAASYLSHLVMDTRT